MKGFELPNEGDAPNRSQGSRWISHKRQALQRVVDCYGACLSPHSPDRRQLVNSADGARRKGYLSKWQHGKIVIGCAL